MARSPPPGGASAGKSIGDIAAYQQAIIEKLAKKPAIIGHSFGGVLVQILAGRGLSAATVAIGPAPSRGVLPLPISALKSSSPVLTNPANRHREPWTLAHDRQRVGRGRQDLARFHPALREMTRIARATRRPAFVAATIGAFTAFVVAMAGTRWRRHWSQNHPAWIGGVLEDTAAAAVARFACHLDAAGSASTSLGAVHSRRPRVLTIGCPTGGAGRAVRPLPRSNVGRLRYLLSTTASMQLSPSSLRSQCRCETRVSQDSAGVRTDRVASDSNNAPRKVPSRAVEAAGLPRHRCSSLTSATSSTCRTMRRRPQDGLVCNCRQSSGQRVLDRRATARARRSVAHVARAVDRATGSSWSSAERTARSHGAATRAVMRA